MTKFKHSILLTAALLMSTFTYAGTALSTHQGTMSTPQEHAIILIPYDVDTAFYMAKNSWGLRDANDMLKEGGSSWMKYKKQDLSWSYVEKPGNTYIIKDENTLKFTDNKHITFYISAKFEKVDNHSSQMTLHYSGSGENISSEFLLQELMMLAYESNVSNVENYASNP